jgi:hypothetical protein
VEPEVVVPLDPAEISVTAESETAVPLTSSVGEPVAELICTSVTGPVTGWPAEFVPVTVKPIRPEACCDWTAADIDVIDSMFAMVEVWFRI